LIGWNPLTGVGSGDKIAALYESTLCSLHDRIRWGIDMYAVIKSGGKQYRVAVGDVLRVETLPGESGSTVELDNVLMVADDGDIKVGDPVLADTTVTATVRGHGRGDKIRVYKFKRRKNYRRTQGHRQNYTELEITAIAGKGA